MLPTIEQLFDLEHTMHEDVFLNIKFPWEVLSELNSYIDKKIQAYEQSGHDKLFQTLIHPTAIIDENVIIGDGTKVGPHVVIQGPTIIGKCCDIRPGAYIRGNSLIGNDCVIGNSTEIKNSLLWELGLLFWR